MTPLLKAFVGSLTHRVEPVPERFADFLRWVDLPPSPVIEAIADASEGRPVTSIDEATCVRVFGCGLAELPKKALRAMACRAGGRGGKTTRLLAPKSVHAAFTVPIPNLAPGEGAFSILVAPKLREARLALNVARGVIERRAELRACVTNGIKGEVGTTDCITIRRPHDKQEVSIIIAAAGGGGLAARGKVILFLGMDEACFFRTEGKSSDQDVYDGAFVRLAPLIEEDAA